MKIYGFVFARGGSKGIPNKNIHPLLGKPIIAYAIEAGQACGRLDKIIVSTDSDKIADVAREYGAEVPFIRPAELASDTAGEWSAWQHAVRSLKEAGDNFDVFVSLPATSPLRTAEDILRCIEMYEQNRCDLVITCTSAHRSPYFNMITMDDQGYASIAMKDSKAPVRRQDVPPVYDMATVAYVSSPEYILKVDNAFAGKVRAVEIDKINAIDLDEPIDLEMAELFLKKRQASL